MGRGALAQVLGNHGVSVRDVNAQQAASVTRIQLSSLFSRRV